MEKVKFTKNGLVGSFWDHNTAKWVDRDLFSSNLPITWFLPHSTYVDDGVTLTDVLNGLTPFIDQVNFVFVNYLMGIKLEDLRTVLEKAPSPEDPAKTDTVCLIWAGEIRADEEGDDLLSIFPSIVSLEISPNDDDELDQFRPLHDITPSDLLNKPIALDDWLEFYNVKEVDKTVMEGAFDWTLYDFLGAVMSELTLYCYKAGLIKLPEGAQVGSMGIKDLFDHMDDLDEYYKNEKGIK
jgi:hypothetical protein